MRSNGLLKWLMIPVAILVLFVGIRLFSGGGSTAPPAADNGAQLTPEEMKALGIEGDTPRDTVATLVAQVKQLRTELQTALSDNKSQREENQRLRQRENSIDQRINSALESERSNLRRDQEQAASARQQTEGLLADLQRRLDSIGGRGGGHADLPVGLGLQGGDEAGMEGGVRWVEPDDAKPAEGRNAGRGASGGMSFPTSFGPAQSTLETTAETVANAGAQVAGVKTAKPVYTVPTNSTLMGSVAMTALIGRVPIDGTVNDPYPFKVLVGPDNLTANGIDIPDVAGAVFSGTASGDWTLSCVRGQVRSITFVFNDGTIRTITCNPYDVYEYLEELENGIKACLKPDAPLVAGDHCHSTFCAARTTCPAREALAVKAVSEQFKSIRDISTITLPAPEGLDVERLSYIKQAGDLLSTWLADVDAHIKELLAQGVHVPGFKIVETEARREWQGDDNELAAKLAALADRPSVDFMRMKLVTITDAERMVTSAFKKRVGKDRAKQAAEDAKRAMALLTIRQSSGNTKVVPEDHPAPAMNRAGIFKATNVAGLLPPPPKQMTEDRR